MNRTELKEAANALPLEPGVYIMRDKANVVIYVGKAKKLKNRVSQYFQDTASHSPKTRLMVSKVDRFEVIVAASEFEALVLECSLIKQYMPKYNILLKDDKGFPYIRIDHKSPYPKLSIANKVSDDGALYFGPFGSRGITGNTMETICDILKLPKCNKTFPKDVGKGRPCLHYHMGQCDGWCQNGKSSAEYASRIEQAKQLLSGNYKKTAEQIRVSMLDAAENLDFELAASLRDRLGAVEILGKKQLVTAGKRMDTDVIGFAQTEAKACFAVLHYCGGDLQDKEYEVFGVQDEPETALSSLVKQYYLSRGLAPKRVLLPFDFEDRSLFEELLLDKFGKKTEITIPQRGDNARLVELAIKNAFEEAERLTTDEDKVTGSLTMLGKMLSMSPPKRVESYDISNISGTDIVASMVVYIDGRPRKKDYRKFKINDLSDQDDYASMHQVITRRFREYLQGTPGFDSLPDLLLIDGGEKHALTALNALNALNISVPIMGMVKDERHRTRALVTSDGGIIRIDAQPSVYALVGNIQEETHRFAISYHRNLRSKRLKYSELDSIEGVGPKRKQDLLKTFKSVSAIKAATMDELLRVLPQNAAAEVYKHFHP